MRVLKYTVKDNEYILQKQYNFPDGIISCIKKKKVGM